MAVHRRTGLKYAVKTVWKSQLRRRADVEDLRREVQVRPAQQGGCCPFKGHYDGPMLGDSLDEADAGLLWCVAARDGKCEWGLACRRPAQLSRPANRNMAASLPTPTADPVAAVQPPQRGGAVADV